VCHRNRLKLEPYNIWLGASSPQQAQVRTIPNLAGRELIKTHWFLGCQEIADAICWARPQPVLLNVKSARRI